MSGRPAGGRRRRARYWIAGALLAAAIGGGLWLRNRAVSRTLLREPPAPDLAGADPAVAEAIRAAAGRVKESPDDAAAWGRLGMVFLAHDYFTAAAAACEQAALRDGRDPRWPYFGGLALLEGDPDPDAALPLLERAAELGGAETAPRLELAEALLERGRIDEAEARFRQVLEIDPGNARARAGLGRSASRRGDLKGALEHLAASARAAPGVKATRALLAEVHHRLGDREAAERERLAVASLPDDPRWPDPYRRQMLDCWVGALALIDRANDLSARGRAPEAVELLRQAAARYPEGLLVHLSLGRTLLQSGDAPAAEEALRRAVRIRPDSFEALYELGSALMAQGKEAEAAGAFGKTLEIKPDFAPAHFNLGRLLLRRGEAAGALAAFQEAVRYRPDFAAAHRELGRALLAAGRREEAVERLRGAVRLNLADREAAAILDEALRQAVTK